MHYVLISVILFLVFLILFFFRGKFFSVFDNKVNELPDFAFKNQESESISLNLKFEKSNSKIGKFLVFDIETTGLPIKEKSSPADYKNWPRVIQISWILFDEEGKEINSETHYISQQNKISAASIKIHRITDEVVAKKGEPAFEVWTCFLKDIANCKYVVTHNNGFDIPIMESELYREHIFEPFKSKILVCTMLLSRNLCKLPSMEIGKYRNPGLEEMMRFCYFPDFNKIVIEGLHDAATDTAIAAKCFFYFLNNNLINLSES